MISPYHFMPHRARLVLFWTVGLFWFLLSYGTVKLLLAREWTSAMVAGGFVVLYPWYAIRILRVWSAGPALEPQTTRPETGSEPIE